MKKELNHETLVNMLQKLIDTGWSYKAVSQAWDDLHWHNYTLHIARDGEMIMTNAHYQTVYEGNMINAIGIAGPEDIDTLDIIIKLEKFFEKELGLAPREWELNWL